MTTFDTGKVLLGEGGPTSQGSHNTGLLMRCPKLYQFWTIRKIRTPGVQTPSHFARGILFTAMRAR